MSENKKRKRAIVKIWQDGITEIHIPTITLSRRQLLLVILAVIIVLVGIKRFPEIIQWANSLLTLIL